MKNLIVVLAAFFSLNAFATSVFANYVELLDSDSYLTEAQVEIVKMAPICPRNPQPGHVTCMGYGTKVTLKITLNACFDRLGPIFYDLINVVGDKGVLAIGVVNINSKKSVGTYCFAPNAVFKTIMVPFEGEIVLKKLRMEGQGQ